MISFFHLTFSFERHPISPSRGLFQMIVILVQEVVFILEEVVVIFDRVWEKYLVCGLGKRIEETLENEKNEICTWGFVSNFCDRWDYCLPL